MKEIGTLKELGVKPGDVVEYQGPIKIKYNVAIDEHGRLFDEDLGGVFDDYALFRIISRASDKPKLWRDMTPEEKGALLLAAHEGKVIEWTGMFGFDFICDSTKSRPVWHDKHAYRIKPEPKIETVKLVAGSKYKWVCVPEYAGYVDPGINTHRITFNLLDGIPDCSSVKMEKL